LVGFNNHTDKIKPSEEGIQACVTFLRVWLHTSVRWEHGKLWYDRRQLILL